MEEVSTKLEVDAPIGVEDDSEKLDEFRRSAIVLMKDVVATNRNDAEAMGMNIEKEVADVFSADNVYRLDIRGRPFENPKVTLWLKDCPRWANTAWTEEFHPFGINAFNGSVTATFDVRPF